MTMMNMTIRGREDRVAKLLAEVRRLPYPDLEIEDITGGDSPDELVFWGNTKKITSFHYGLEKRHISSTIGKNLNANLPSHRKHFIRVIEEVLS